MAVKLSPLGDKVIIERIAERMTNGGIVIPETSGEKPQRGKVCAIGPGKKNDNGTVYTMSLKVGDEVLFGKYAGTEFKIDGKDLLVISETEVIAVIE
jgi:chaperonin GroES